MLKVILDLLAQKAVPALVIEDTSVPDGQDSCEQSRIPLSKSMLVHKQAMSFALHPKPGANANMFLMHVCC